MKYVIQGLVAFALMGVIMFGLAKVTRGSHTEALYEAAVRYAAQDPTTGGSKIYFVQLSGKDPERQFLQRFDGNKFEVRAHSSCVEAGGPANGSAAKDKSTGEAGVSLRFDAISWPAADQAVVHAGKDLYVMKQTGEKWTVDFHGHAAG